MATEVAEGPDEIGVGDVAEKAVEISPVAAPSSQALPEGVRRRLQEVLVFLIRHLVDAGLQQQALLTGEELLEPAPVLDRDRLPSRRSEHSLETPGSDIGHDPIE